MFLSNLKINGFKSFPYKTELKFSKGMTCIIGPNGCGKSNIVDSIRWVIGEQRAGAVRSDKMTDVIFNGTNKKKPLGMAEVELTIVNDRGVLPSEYTDVVVTRRVFRSGQSEYLLNGAQCRLKDIQHLFMDKGMGSGAYSVIELKMVEQILSNSNTDRRMLFEEAAGIKKYKQRRNSAKKKLADVQQDLLRVNDVIEEIRKNVNSLSRQVAKVKRYRALKEELLNLEVDVATKNYFNLIKQIDPLESRLKELLSGDLESGKQLSLDETLIENYKTELIGIEDELSKSRQSIFAQDEKIRLIQEQELVSSEKLKNSDELITRLELDIEQTLQRKITAEDVINEKRKTLETVQTKLETFDQNVELVEDEYNDTSSKLFKEKSDAELKQTKLKTIQHDTNKLNNEIDQTKFKKSELEKRIKSLQTFDKSLIESINSEIEIEQNEIDQLTTILSKEENVFKDISENLIKTKNDLENKQSEKKEHDKAYLLLESKRNLLEDSLLSGDLHPDDIKSFLDESYEFESFVGLLSEVIEVIDENDEETYGKLLQPYASLPVFKNISFEEVQLLNKKFPSIRSFIIPESYKNQQSHEYSINKKLSSTILSDSDIEYLFGSWVYLPNFEKLNQFIERSHTVLTDHGMFNNGERTLSFFQRNEDGLNLIGAEKQIERLDIELEEIQLKIDNSDDAIFSIEDCITKLNESLELSSSKQNKIKDDMRVHVSKVEELSFKKKHYEEQFANSEREIQSFQEEINKLNETLSVKLPMFDSYAAEEEELETALKDALLNVEQLSNTQSKLKDKINDLKVERSSLDSEENNLKDTLRREYYFLKDADSQVEHKRNEIDSIRNQKTNFGEESSNRKDILEKLQLEKDDMLNNKAQIEDKYTKVKDDITKLEQQVKEFRLLKEKTVSEKQQLELKVQELYVKSQSIAEQAYKDHEVQIVERKPNEDLNLLQAEQQIYDVRGKITSLGEVNSLAIEEYDKEKERFDFLEEQRNDILQSEKMLIDTIDTINETAQNQFNDIFEQIRTNFKTVFGEFFKNGEGDLELIQAEDPLEGKIEINVRPKGRTLQTLALMSGGEKTLTAISLLFSIYLVKPSPFCILDEVDAPLDDVNITRFTDALKKFTHLTQFIIVTHNKRTIEAADYMYGVTQEHVGISKLVSVKFD